MACYSRLASAHRRWLSSTCGVAGRRGTVSRVLLRSETLSIHDCARQVPEKTASPSCRMASYGAQTTWNEWPTSREAAPCTAVIDDPRREICSICMMLWRDYDLMIPAAAEALMVRTLLSSVDEVLVDSAKIDALLRARRHNLINGISSPDSREAQLELSTVSAGPRIPPA